jgi:hypothetical protein
VATSFVSTPTTAVARLVPIPIHPSGVKRFEPFTGLSTASRCFRDFINLRPFRLTSSIAGGLRVIVHANDEERRYDAEK